MGAGPGETTPLRTLHSDRMVIAWLQEHSLERSILFVTFIAASLLAGVQNVAADGGVIGAPSPSILARWACTLQTSTGLPLEVNVKYDAKNRQVAVDIPSLRHNFTRSAKFDFRFMMWTEEPAVGRAVLWTIVRSTLEIRLTRITGSTPHVNLGRCRVQRREG